MKKVLLISLTGAILIGCVITQTVALQSAQGRLSVTQTDTLPDAEKTFIMGEQRGRLAVWRTGESEPFLTTDTFTYMLPKSDKRKIEQGIEIKGEEQLRKTLEDYCS